MPRAITVFLLLLCLVGNALADNLRIRYLAIGDVPRETMDQIELTMDKHAPEILSKYAIKNMPNVTVESLLVC